MEHIEITYEFAEKYLRYANPQHTQVYLYLKYIFSTRGEIPSIDDISAELDIAPNRIKFILGFWVSEGELIQSGDDYTFPETDTEGNAKNNERPKPKKSSRRTASSRPSYKSAEIDTAAEKNQVLSGMFYQAESILGHLLSGNEMELLYSFYDWLGLPCEVIVMLLNYAVSHGKTGKRYLETVAIDWADKAIDTFEKAEEYIKHLEESEKAERKICAVLGIYDRALTQTEKKYITAWSDMKLDIKLVELAYDRTVTNTGKLSYSYMNKILASWQSEGLTSVDAVKRSDELHSLNSGKPAKKSNNGSQKSKFNNFENTEKVDYDSLEEKIFDMFLDN